MEPYVGEIKMIGFSYAPDGWLPCDGRLVPITQFQALFSLLGNKYGGDGRTNFGLPDLRGRVPVGIGAGPGLSGIEQGQLGGVESVTLTNSQMPAHNHTFAVANVNGDTTVPVAGASLAVVNTGGREPEQHPAYLASGNPSIPLNPTTVQPSGGSQPHENRQPFIGTMFIIATNGVFPPRP
ncbi:phage tail protein [Flaviaesturariibacter flavus]|uniref:Phage tail protein n=1 Tax=Flaviaesturariibacter flavus TaxID=2502780 RepID=A0A4R1B8Q0_9BACT|nr:tail fiber protein [Flaviaesturariibacter flavus]TCJ12643.1 phage tail protein [Flaviaesturariibacter flavus]